ncbi:hypothetical protein Val02_72820 [Virgisporangium aliadipatigenens]|uniref:DUF2795 domain-containing protein n=1 Tax=Virgisporangium aliadipatigenens TaxID=741659 RepID=A0A8J4DUI3_9ACTN|nr:DUF2795 domain-containing protein [Virgisporangium aliadipatigenens]GIJ50396.1 hypothetical protein Val02_72820 [Virgisporangium aliadipatigenens]
MTTVDEVLRYLDGLDYPATRDEIVQEAEREGAPNEVLKALRGMPPVDYRNKDEVVRSAKTDIAQETPAEKAAKARDKKHQRVAEYLRDTT